MSIEIPICELTAPHLTYIREKLFISPVPSYFSASILHAPVPKPIQCYIFNKDRGSVSLPLWFALTLFQLTANELETKSTTWQKTLGKHCAVEFNFKGSLLPHQIPVVDLAYNQLKEFGTTTLGVYPGFGKTVASACLSSLTRRLVLVLNHRSILEPQWEKTFTEFTDAKVWIVGSKNDIITNGKHFPCSPCNVIICMDQRVENIDDSILDAIGCLVIDEAHAFCVPSRVFSLLRTHPRYIIAATATLNRSDGMEIMVQWMCGPHSINIPSQKDYNVIKFETGINLQLPLNRMGKPDWTKYVGMYNMNEDRNRMIICLVKRYKEMKILILTGRKDHATLLFNALLEEKEDVSVMMGSMKGYRNARILIGTISKIGTGFDEKMACADYDGKRLELLITVQSIKSEVILEQTTGRIFRAAHPTVVDFVDNNPISKRHWRIRNKWYEKSGAIVTKEDGTEVSVKDEEASTVMGDDPPDYFSDDE